MKIPAQFADPSHSNRAGAARGVVVAVAAVVPVFLTGALAVQIRAELAFGPAALGGAVAIY
ncbi:MAG: hypothetical protein ACRDU8_04240, partial [Egibacteraceae bacterium]